ncbi:testosterone 17-beta-dehydrogenase 3-like [Limosa lapponica baueri]|uniref:Testosterone 17-beta-dehydrogenase 3-like n=1 Tax=Limosa lapponica baueri TaxID=1758121 RepID=A0A2I0U479_LIMLA|nr:testosterone 17-beta-dehydrogenase 3-like [Limosa lapponica baueri]
MQLAFWAASAHCRLMLSFSSTNTPKSFSSGLLSSHSLPNFVPGIATSQMQDLALDLVELHAVCTSLSLKPVQVPLDGIPSLQHVDHATKLGVVSKLAEGALNPTVHVSSKDVEQHWSQY